MAASTARPLRYRKTVVIACAMLLLNLAFGARVMRNRANMLRLAPGGTVSDLHLRWLSTRDLILHGVNPYGEAAAREGERGFYGRTLTDAERSLDTENYVSFNYPMHFAVLLAPLALLPFPLVQVLVTIVLVLLLAWATAAWCAALGWPATRLGRFAACLAVVTSLPALDLLSLQQPTGFVLALLVLAALHLTENRRLRIAGAAAACATIKPQLVALPLTVAIVWTLARPRRRWPFAAALVATLALLVGISFVLLPGWPAWFAANVRAYAGHVPQSGVIAHVAAWPVRAVIGGLVVGVTFLTLFLPGVRRQDRGEMLSAFAVSLAATLVISVADHLYDRVLLVPALLSLAALHRSHTFAPLSAAGLAGRLVLAMLMSVFAGGALLGLLLHTGAAPVVLSLSRAVLTGYAVLPLAVWLALVLAMVSASVVRASDRG